MDNEKESRALPAAVPQSHLDKSYKIAMQNLRKSVH